MEKQVLAELALEKKTPPSVCCILSMCTSEMFD